MTTFSTIEEVRDAGRVPKPNVLVRGDCLKVLPFVPAGKIDMVFADLPYGLMSIAWDAVIPFEDLWPALRRVTKPNAAIILTASQPFTTTMIASNHDDYRYVWYWIKGKKTNPYQARLKPMLNVEEVVVFYREQPTYNPQGITKIPTYKTKTTRDVRAGGAYGAYDGSYRTEYTNYPHQTLSFDHDPVKLHPTQKPVALVEYMIRTYTNPGEVVLDCTCGSGTTAVAAMRSGRRFVCIEQDPDIFETSRRRIEAVESNPGMAINAG